MSFWMTSGARRLKKRQKKHTTISWGKSIKRPRALSSNEISTKECGPMKRSRIRKCGFCCEMPFSASFLCYFPPPSRTIIFFSDWININFFAFFVLFAYDFISIVLLQTPSHRFRLIVSFMRVPMG